MSQGIASILSTTSDTAQLRLQAGSDVTADDEVVEQFEALFLQQMLKSMRTASLSEGLFQSDQSEFYRDMYDQQIAADLADQELLGIAQLINRQLGRDPDVPAQANNEQIDPSEGIVVKREELPAVETNEQVTSTHKDSVDLTRLDAYIEKLTASINEENADKAVNETALTETMRPLAFKPESPNEFVKVAYQYAHAPAEKLGVDPQVLVAIAALETGWGNHVPSDGSGSSNNYFGIKADNRWQGDHVGNKTLEFDQSTFAEQMQSFRAYETIKDSFNDYAEFLLSNDRYSYALEFVKDTKRFLNEIQNAGYATDPKYADKIMNVLNNKAFSLSQ